MKSKKITSAEIDSCKVASLPTRPNSGSFYGGKGYSAEDMKAAFDKLPLLIAERYNALLDDIYAEYAASICHAILTDIYPGHTLGDMFYEIKSGDMSAYLNAGSGKSLATELYEIKTAIRALGGEI